MYHDTSRPETIRQRTNTMNHHTPRIRLTESTDAKNGRLSDPRKPNQRQHTMTDAEEFFCLAADGLIYFLGNHGDYEAAEETAADIGVDVIWMFGQETAKSWVDTINHHLKNNLTKDKTP